MPNIITNKAMWEIRIEADVLSEYAIIDAQRFACTPLYYAYRDILAEVELNDDGTAELIVTAQFKPSPDGEVQDYRTRIPFTVPQGKCLEEDTQEMPEPCQNEFNYLAQRAIERMHYNEAQRLKAEKEEEHIRNYSDSDAMHQVASAIHCGIDKLYDIRMITGLPKEVVLKQLKAIRDEMPGSATADAAEDIFMRLFD